MCRNDRENNHHKRLASRRILNVEKLEAKPRPCRLKTNCQRSTLSGHDDVTVDSTIIETISKSNTGETTEKYGCGLSRASRFHC